MYGIKQYRTDTEWVYGEYTVAVVVEQQYVYGYIIANGVGVLCYGYYVYDVLPGEGVEQLWYGVYFIGYDDGESAFGWWQCEWECYGMLWYEQHYADLEWQYGNNTVAVVIRQYELQ